MFRSVCSLFLFFLLSLSYSLHSQNTRTIPKILHQTWKTKKLPKKQWEYNQKQVQKFHPDYKYMFWTDKDFEPFVARHFPKYLNNFKALPQKIMKVDVFRYMLLYVYGGVYLDMDYLNFKTV